MLRVEAAALARPCKYQAKSKDAGVWTPPPLAPGAIAALAHSVYRAFRLRLATAVHSDVTRSFGPQQLPCPGRGAAPPGRSRPSSRALVVRCRPGTVRVCGGPGSAVHRSTSLRAAPRPGHPIASDAFVALFTFQTAQIFSFPRRMSASGVCNFCFANPNRGVGGAPRDVRVQRHPFGVHITRHARRLRGALRPMTRDARLSALHRGGFRLRGRACLTGICAGSVTASSSHPGKNSIRSSPRKRGRE